METTCIFEGCGRRAHSRGLCHGHYKQRNAGLALAPLRIVLPHSVGAEERFWSKVPTRGSEGCWEWTGARDGNGYGRLTLTRDGGRRAVLAHRFAWEMANGRPSTMFLCHSCDNPSCVRPDHLFEGTQADNMRDCAKKGRIFTGGAINPQKGERRYNAKLTAEIVRDLRAKYAHGELRASIEGKRLGVTHSVIRKAAIGESWRSADGP